MFLLDGFDEEETEEVAFSSRVEGVDGGSTAARGNPLAFPQSDDEEISTDGELLEVSFLCDQLLCS